MYGEAARGAPGRHAPALDPMVIFDPFMGSGATVAACEAIGVESIGVERHREYFDLAEAAIPRLKALETDADELVGAGLRLF